MPTKTKFFRWGLIAGYLVLIASMLACMAIGLGTSNENANVDKGTLQIENGSID